MDLILGFLGITVFGCLLAKLSETRRGMWYAAGLYLAVVLAIVAFFGGTGHTGPLVRR